MSVTNISKTLYRKDGRVRGSFVYMLLCQDDAGPIYVKIGMSDDPFQRMQALRNGCPVQPRRFAFVAVPSRRLAKKIESFLHGELSPWRSQGEWFKFEPAEKADFNKGWQSAFRKAAIPGYPLEWTHIAVEFLIKEWDRRRNVARGIWKKRGRVYQDFRKHCKT